ncbi:glycoside hydrolase family 18 protein [Panaeolus papilionaceus]|nr:glycoside hydrolase family 18 protein [Panaeolus papilionaceus]
MTATVSIKSHTTSSHPRPHILYTIEANLDGRLYTAQRRYSEFVALHVELKDPYNLPPKRLLTTTFVPSAWLDNTLINERKAGLQEYLSDLLATPKYQDKPVVFEFLSAQTLERERDGKFDLEDALPSTMTRAKALNLASNPMESEISTAAAMINASYYADWAAGRLPPENVDFSKFDIIYFSFVTPSSTFGINWGNGGQALLKRLVTAAKNSGYGTRICLAVGGWGGCYYFSEACSTASNRTKFANAMISAVNTLNLDGIDLDWEYPNSPGAGQPYRAADAANLLLLIQLLRAALGPCKILSAAVAHMPWLGSNGKPLTDLTAYAAELTYVNIMNYDVWGASANPGPNAPMGNLCGTSWQPQASAQAALEQWKKANFPGWKILLGLALYGYVSKSSKTVLTGSSMPTDGMLLLTKDDVTEFAETHPIFLNGAHANPPHSEQDEPIKTQATLTSWWGRQIPFYEIVRAGALVKRSDGNYGQAGGFTMGWDNCSNTPYLFKTSETTVISYDDTWSLTDKAKFAREAGMAGCFTWSMDQDDGLTLTNAIHKGLGK